MMSARTFQERRLVIRLLADRAGRAAMTSVLQSPVLRWRYGAPEIDELLWVPQELRTADPSFAREIEHGMFGLGGSVVSVGSGSIFEAQPPSSAWAAQLHGFGWLRHLSAAGSDAAREFARNSVKDWISRHRSRHGLPWSGDVAGRRVFSWLANAEFLLRGTDEAFYDRFADSLGQHLVHLSAKWRDAPGGRQRLTALIGLLTGAMCVTGQEKAAERAQRDLAVEIRRQILADGGHRSRDPMAVVELLLDLLPLRTCFNARQMPMPADIQQAIPKMLRFVQFMRLGDGAIGRFNGAGASPLHTLATLATYVSDDQPPLQTARPSGYARLESGDGVVLMDGGPPPAMVDAGAATAGCLSFEYSYRDMAVFVNGGAPGPAEQDWLSQSRATASHNTLVLGAQSSSRMVQHPTLTRLVGGSPIRLPENVSMTQTGDHDARVVEGSHDGYREQHGLLHKRRLELASSGDRLEGRDEITSAGRQMRLPRDIPFSIHFHLHPDVVCLPEASPVAIRFRLIDGSVWQFASDDATLSLEDSIHYADYVGPARSQQIVLRGACFGDKTVIWRVGRVD
jgi:uncharacterized heparinase superfamily protein